LKISYLIKNSTKTIIGSILLFPKSLIKFFFNLNLIRDSKNIIIHFGDGYGDHFTHHDLARYYFRGKKTLYIHFFETDRHNTELVSIFSDRSIFFKNNFKIILFGRSFKFGEFERSLIKPLNFSIFFLVKLLKKKKTKIFFYPYFYNKINDTYKKFNISNNLCNPENKDQIKDWLIYYYKLVKKYNKISLLKLNSPLSSYKTVNRNSKICSIYLRDKNFQSKDLSSSRSGSSNLETYLPTFKFLLDQGYNIFLLGDRNFQIDYKNDDLKFINVNFIKDNKLREKVELFSLINSNLLISELGGLSYFGLYLEKILLINYFPSNFPFPAPKLKKKIYDKINRQYIDLEKLSNNDQFEIFKKENFDLINNESDEILDFVKKNLKK